MTNYTQIYFYICGCLHIDQSLVFYLLATCYLNFQLFYILKTVFIIFSQLSPILLFLSHCFNYCHMQVHPSRKLHPCGDIISKSYKPTFHGGYLSCNMSYGCAATLWVFCLLQQRYSYSTQSFMIKLLLLVSQH